MSSKVVPARGPSATSLMKNGCPLSSHDSPNRSTDGNDRPRMRSRRRPPHGCGRKWVVKTTGRCATTRLLVTEWPVCDTRFLDSTSRKIPHGRHSGPHSISPSAPIVSCPEGRVQRNVSDRCGRRLPLCDHGRSRRIGSPVEQCRYGCSSRFGKTIPARRRGSAESGMTSALPRLTRRTGRPMICQSGLQGLPTPMCGVGR